MYTFIWRLLDQLSISRVLLGAHKRQCAACFGKWEKCVRTLAQISLNHYDKHLLVIIRKHSQWHCLFVFSGHLAYRLLSRTCALSSALERTRFSVRQPKDTGKGGWLALIEEALPRVKSFINSFQDLPTRGYCIEPLTWIDCTTVRVEELRENFGYVFWNCLPWCTLKSMDVF